MYLLPFLALPLLFIFLFSYPHFLGDRLSNKYRPDLVNRSVIEIVGVRFEGDLQLVIALAQQPDLMEAARKAARLKKLWVHYRIESTPLDLLYMTGGRDRLRED